MQKLTYLLLTVLIVACSNDDNGENNQSSCNGDNPVYLADNGVTIKACDDAAVNSTGVINGVTYTVVDRILLKAMIDNEEDVTKVATTKVTDMGSLFSRASSFNQPIGNWDVSNVTRMESMFEEANDFNQDISSWDVNNVTDMSNMFEDARNFNQPTGNWDVSNVVEMNLMFFFTVAFNQNLSAWDVGNVTECRRFTAGAAIWLKPKPNFTKCDPFEDRALIR